MLSELTLDFRAIFKLHNDAYGVCANEYKLAGSQIFSELSDGNNFF